MLISTLKACVKRLLCASYFEKQYTNILVFTDKSN